MSKILFIAAILMYASAEHLIKTEPFGCDSTLPPAACKTKFGQQFELNALALQLKTAREIFHNYINLTTQLKAELEPTNPYAKAIEENNKNLKITLKKLSQAENGQEKLIQLMSNGMHEMEIDTTRTDIDRNITLHIKKLFDKYAISPTLGKSVHTFLEELSWSWSEMFANLRAEDLKEFPVYEEINAHMLCLRDEGRKAEKISHFESAKSLLFEKFHLQLFKEENSFF